MFIYIFIYIPDIGLKVIECSSSVIDMPHHPLDFGM